jgi:hypothetical protein
MTKPRDPDALLSAYLADGMEVLPDRVADSVLNEIHRTRQRAVFGPWRTRSMSKPSLAAAAVVAVLVSGALLMTRPDQSAIGDPSPSVPGIVAPSTTPTATPSAEVSPTPDAHSLKLTWTKGALDGRSPQVAWLGGRFVLVDQDTGVVRTSTDGKTWHALQPGDDPGYAELLRPRRGHPAGAYVSWEDEIVGWWNPQEPLSLANQPPVTARDILRIVRPPAQPRVTTPFKGRIESIGIGPKGIVAQVHSHIDWDAWVATRLGENWVSHFTGMEFRDGILDISVDNGPGLHVVWADEGFEPGDYMDAGFEWYSPDGEQWTAIPSVGSPESDGFRGFPTGFGDVVGVSDGFIARGPCTSDGGCTEMWHSSDGLTWRNIGNVVNGSDGQLLSWMGGALVTDGVGRFDFWTSQGGSELPMAAELPVAWKQAEGNTEEFGMGPLGLVTARKDYAQILFTRDGVAWDIQAMPAEMEPDLPRTMGGLFKVVVGERSVLVVSRSATDEATSLWLGTPEP